MSHYWHNYNKKLKLSDAKNTRKIDAFFSKQKSSERWELQVGELSESSPSSSNTMIEVVEQGKVGHQHQRPQPENTILNNCALGLIIFFYTSCVDGYNFFRAYLNL